ncbi:hypothetical protein RA28_02495 [Ruegeria sp. ANG-S4]|nr:hypothetical protein RA28_02495 [Ruegeria sp. ANG-S4]
MSKDAIAPIPADLKDAFSRYRELLRSQLRLLIWVMLAFGLSAMPVFMVMKSFVSELVRAGNWPTTIYFSIALIGHVVFWLVAMNLVFRPTEEKKNEIEKRFEKQNLIISKRGFTKVHVESVKS